MSHLPETLQAWNDHRLPRVLVVAHRGVWSEVPENSLPAIEAAVAAGADIVELDLHRTRDGQYVLLHDHTLERTTDGGGSVAELTLAQLRALHLGSRPAGPRTAVPTLQEALEAVRGRIMANLDVKAGELREIASLVRRAGLAEQVILKRRGAPDPFHPGQGIYLPIVETLQELGEALARRYAVVEIHAYGARSAMLGEGIRRARGAGARVWINALGRGEESGGLGDWAGTRDPSVYGRLVDSGAGVLQTDHVTHLLRYLRSRDLAVAGGQHRASESGHRENGPAANETSGCG